MYTCIHRVYMWEVEPTLYWRVKKNGKWTWVRAQVVHQEWNADELTVYIDTVPTPEVDESE